MSKKRKNEGFNANPFKQLKGFAVSAQTPIKNKATENKSRLDASSQQVKEESEPSFLQEMEKMGMDKVFAGNEKVVRPEPRDEAPALEPTPCRPKTEEELFLTALGQMDKVFKDEIPVQDETLPAPRRMKQIRQGRLTPEASLDLHGLSRIEAREKTRFFLQDAHYQGKKAVLIITGKGYGSDGEPVLRKDMERYLSVEAKAWVSEWGRAPRQFGGDGALVVFIRQRKEG